MGPGNTFVGKLVQLEGQWDRLGGYEMGKGVEGKDFYVCQGMYLENICRFQKGIDEVYGQPTNQKEDGRV